jgi:hypothetical protein
MFVLDNRFFPSFASFPDVAADLTNPTVHKADRLSGTPGTRVSIVIIIAEERP